MAAECSQMAIAFYMASTHHPSLSSSACQETGCPVGPIGEEPQQSARLRLKVTHGFCGM